MRPDLEALAAEVALSIKSVLAPLQQQVAAQAAQIVELEKYAGRIEGYTSFLQRDAAALGERVAAVEVKAMQPGPPGEPGAPGKDGADGKAGLTYLGVYQDGKSYDLGELVTWGGSMWHCNEPTESKPGEGSKAWTLTVKRGRDGKDGKP